MRGRLVALTIALAAMACGGNAASTNASQPRPVSGRSGNVVTAEEIQRHGSGNLLDVLRTLRPIWFRQAPTAMSGNVVYVDAITVYIDGRRLGGPSALRDIPVGSVMQVRFYSASEAQGRFGLDNLQGAIEVSTIR